MVTWRAGFLRTSSDPGLVRPVSSPTRHYSPVLCTVVQSLSRASFAPLWLLLLAPGAGPGFPLFALAFFNVTSEDGVSQPGCSHGPRRLLPPFFEAHGGGQRD